MLKNEMERVRKNAGVLRRDRRENGAERGHDRFFFKGEQEQPRVFDARPVWAKAVTHYVSVRENAQYSLLRVTIDTGRKNQIRVQLKEAGHPVVGDEKYEASKNPLGRLGLHASKLEFSHPLTGEEISVGSSLPPSFKGLF